MSSKPSLSQRAARPKRNSRIASPPAVAISMIWKKPAPDVIRGGHRFSEKIMLKQEAKAECALAAARKHCRQFTPAQINSLRTQSAVPRDPPAHAIRIVRPQIFGPRFVGLGAGQARVPGGVEGKHRARRHADAIVR